MTVVQDASKEKLLVETENTTLITTQEHYGVVVTQTEGTAVALSKTETVVTSPELPSSYLTSGTQGPPGVPGASTQFEYHVAGTILGGNRAVTLNSSGQLIYPDPTSANSFVVGITTGSAALGELATVQITGTQQEPTWNWTPGLPVFVYANGILTQTPPTTGQVLVIGYSTSPTKIHIDKQPPIFME